MEKSHKSPHKKKCAAWKNRTLMERYLILVSIVFFVAFIVLSGVLVHFKNIFKRNSKEPVCLTSACKNAAGRILNNLDFSVHPCDDFYNFSCGSYLKYKNVYDDIMNPYDELSGWIKLLKKEVLEKPEEKDEPRFVSKVRKYYHSCLKKSPSVKDLLKIFLNVTGFNEWPLYKTDSVVLEETIAKSIYINTGFIFDVYTSYKDDFFEYIGIVPTGITISEHGLLNTTEEDSIRLKMHYLDLFRYVFSKLDLKDSESLTEEIIDMETSLAQITEKENSPNSTKKTVLELESECPEIKWTTVFKLIYDYLDYSSNYSTNLTINVNDMDYMISICEFVKENDYRIMHNLIVWNTFAKYLYRTDFVFSQLVNILGFDSQLRITESLTNKLKWKVCISNFQFIFEFGVRFMLLNTQIDHYDDKVRKMENYAKRIIKESEKIFYKESWIDDYSKNVTKMMIANMKYGIGYHNSSLDIKELEMTFDKINIGDNYLENILNTKIYQFSDFLFNGIINQNFNKEETFNPFVVNAFYFGKRLKGRFILPLGIMLPPFYSHDAPNYLNYGGIGRIIGHELSHKFDDLEINETEEEENENNETIIWPKEFLEEYTKRKLCLINQYSKFILEGNVTVDGNSSIRDNIADNSGVIQAYWAYDNYLKEHGKEPNLPGLDFSNRQMFFIGYAQTKCEKLESMKESYEHSSHSPGRYRLLVPLMNFPEFSKVFNCPLNSYMNPEEKCKLWGWK
ncbi:endothelin-converting enzyme 1-like isoform X1 [Centruroides vittatus]|uniref:endothelin-converting enzyme 1-like isoform X1 n=2 Tax=Centruroides vittatus TaxID=120091 RepID=UPI00350F8832